MDEKLFETLYEKILTGDIFAVLSFVLDTIAGEDIFLNGSLKKMCVSFLILAVLAGIFSAFMDSFRSTEASKMSCFMIYLLLFSTLFTLFGEMQTLTKQVIEGILTVMNAGIPVYYLAVVSSGHGLSAYTYYRVSILAIYVVEQLILYVLLPLVSCYVVLSFGNSLWLEKKLSLITGFLKKAVSVALTTLVGVISGISFLQSMVSPMLDGLTNGTTKKVVSLLPGIGNAAEGMTELTMGSLLLIKNSVGLSIFLILIITAAIPVLKLLVVSFVLKGCGALMSVISEKDFARPVLDTADAVMLLLKIILAVFLLFVVSMAIVLFTTGR